jgi:hypothetical protein
MYTSYVPLDLASRSSAYMDGPYTMYIHITFLHLCIHPIFTLAFFEPFPSQEESHVLLHGFCKGCIYVVECYFFDERMFMA